MPSLDPEIIELLSSDDFKNTVKEVKKENDNFNKEHKFFNFKLPSFKDKIKNISPSLSFSARLTTLEKKKYRSFLEIYYEPFIKSISSSSLIKFARAAKENFIKSATKVKNIVTAKNNFLLKLMGVGLLLFLILDKDTISSLKEKVVNAYDLVKANVSEAFIKHLEKFDKGGNVKEKLKLLFDDIKYLFDYYFNKDPKKAIDKKSILELLKEHNVSPNIPNIIGSISGENRSSSKGLTKKIYSNFYTDRSSPYYLFKDQDQDSDDIMDSLAKKENRLNELIIEFVHLHGTDEEITHIDFLSKKEDRERVLVGHKEIIVDRDYDKISSAEELWSPNQRLHDVKVFVDNYIESLENTSFYNDENKSWIKGIKEVLPEPIEGKDLDTLEAQKAYHHALTKIKNHIDQSKLRFNNLKENREEDSKIILEKAKKRKEVFNKYLSGKKNWFSDAKIYFTFDKLEKYYKNMDRLNYESFYSVFETEMNYFIETIYAHYYKIDEQRKDLSKTSKSTLSNMGFSVNEEKSLSNEAWAHVNGVGTSSLNEKKRNFDKINKIIDFFTENTDQTSLFTLDKSERK